MTQNIIEMDYAEVWFMFAWLSWLSHYELSFEDMKVMDLVEGR